MRTRLPHLSKPAAGLLLASAAVAMSVAAVAYAGASSEQPAPTPIAPGVALDPANQPEVYNSLPPEKRAFLDRENAQRNQVLTPAAQRTIVPRSKTPQPEVPPYTGQTRVPAGTGVITERDCDQLFRKAGLQTNRWLAIGEPRTIFVCAGANPADPAQGWVFVHYYSADNSSVLPDREQPATWFYPTPGRTGAVRIIGAVGNVLTLKSDSGQLYFFGAEALRYVDSPKPEATTGPR